MSAQPIVATDRAALILQLVPYLIAAGEVTVEQAACDFEVSAEQMREMVRKLTVIGLPGEGGFWQMANDLFDIDWDLLEREDRIVITNSVGLERSPRLTAREAAALLAGLQLAASLPGVGDSDVMQGLLAKLARGAGQTPAEVIIAPAPVDEVRETVARALRERVAVSFTYRAPDAPGPTKRTVDPVKVSISDGQWYLQGWCHMRRAMRTFHLDRIADAEATQIPAVHASEPVPELFQPGEDEVVAEIRFPVAATAAVGEYLANAEVRADGPWRIARIRVADARSLKRLVARAGGAIEIVAPIDARRAAHDWASAALDLYE
ncbi:helix-turn-helix transcriptional regulator [Microbacterium imperiale]|uniref:Protein pafC n=1 Tax=Microbacterium imperiale TaxID=33884 RepID=A0A9W6HG81_9MICO|nr:WYL domain-containing protein [Microbacterium imperiale]MBP2419410.1 proteasome accessory factor C [Microbacterium imperiale]MDS0198720.1 WYL domain-containing protein [Microbacterium imperiale]BFE39752.1 WYL domain-containing protein [Microbacterium imperiale]GLJ79272.1 protein pafC [Microbacterium imperiale]